MKWVVFLGLLAFAAATKRYDGFRVLRTYPKSAQDVQSLQYLENNGRLDFWSPPRVGKTDIMANTETLAYLESWLKKSSIDYTLMVPDVQTLIENVARTPRVQAGPRSPSYKLTWDDYYPLADIQAFADSLAAAYPDKVTVSSAGKSVEGRDLTLIKLSTGGSGKNAIFIDGGIHAREWISPATVTWLVQELVENYAAHPEYLDNLDWYVMPVINPDGYVYTFSDDRLWRKNRGTTNHAQCIGTDMNRNFGFHWNEGGSSPNGCIDTYRGPEAFSEIESQVVRDTILSIAGQTKVYLTFHSYGQYWLFPWGYTSDLPDDYDALNTLALSATKALAGVYGTKYTVGTSTNTLYIASGGSDDWAKGGAGISYSYTVELRDTGAYGFVLPPSEIMPTVTETWEAIKVVADATINM